MKNLLILLMMLSVSSQLVAQKGKGRPASEKIQAVKIAVFTEELQLTSKEAEKFWPLYNEYEDKVKKIDKETREISKDLETKSDSEIEAGIEKRFQLKEQRIDLEREYHEQFKKLLPIQKVAKISMAQRKFKKRLVGEMRRQRQDGRRGQ
jgi:Skp family chaperone for outer membrane proteins